jgi:hypothetical protein
MPPFQSPQTMIREDFVRIVLACLTVTTSPTAAAVLFAVQNKFTSKLSLASRFRPSVSRELVH